MTNNEKAIVIVLIVVLVLLLFGGFGIRSYLGEYYGLGGLLGVIAVILAIWVIYDVIVNNQRLSDGMKVLWIICAVLFSIITAIIYYLVGRNSKNDLFKKR